MSQPGGHELADLKERGGKWEPGAQIYSEIQINDMKIDRKNIRVYHCLDLRATPLTFYVER